MNYTYYNKISDLLKLNRADFEKKAIKEMNEVMSKTYNNLWGGRTQAQNEFIKIIKKLLKYNNLKIRNLKFKLIKEKISIRFDKKIRVAFFVNEYSTFPSVMSVYDLMNNDKKFICDLVHIPFIHPDKKYDAVLEINEYKKMDITKL